MAPGEDLAARADAQAKLIAWLLHQGCECDDLGAIVEGLTPQLIALGLPLCRLSLTVPMIDPTTRALAYVWSPDEGLAAERIASGAESEAMFQSSPLFYMRRLGLAETRWNLEARSTRPWFPLFDRLRAAGVTEYAVTLVGFSARRTALEGVALSMATTRPGGFAETEIHAVLPILPALALAVYRVALLHVATDTLGAYLGANTGRNVLKGMVHRGDSRRISAALLLADLRGFTAVSDRADAGAVVAWLNEHLEAIGEPVAEAGGEVLKFLGDGLLAVFPAEATDRATACASALAAAREALARNAALNAARAAKGEPELGLMLVLHFGEVYYGNVGTARRLDFTVIGPAVNEASRMEALGKMLGEPLLLSATFAAHCAGAHASLGRHALRGIAGEQEIFVPS